MLGLGYDPRVVPPNTRPGFSVEQQAMHERGLLGEGLFNRSASTSSMPSPVEKPVSLSQEIYQPPPPSGYRIALASNAPLPSVKQTGPPPFYDADGVSPVFVGSALLDYSVHPCKICPALDPPCRVPLGSSEYSHHGRFDLLPITPAMEWVVTSGGDLPFGRRPVEGGYEQNGERLYHASAIVSGVEVPGKAGRHLGGANIAFGGSEVVVTHQYKVFSFQGAGDNSMIPSGKFGYAFRL